MKFFARMIKQRYKSALDSSKKNKQGRLRTYFFEPPPPCQAGCTAPLEFLGFYFTPGNSRQNKASPLETPQNCVTLLRNFKA